MSDPARQFLRHTVATVAYRGGKAIRNAPSAFADFKNCETTRTPLAILAHIGDLYDWALSIARGAEKWTTATPLSWEQECARFFATLKAFVDYLASAQPLKESPEKLFQGPVADSLTHVGQLTMLRRMSGAPIKGESYHKAEIVTGRIGPEQAAPRREFD
ncbi:MAG TPA: hypothetical protein VMZ25_08660 [Terriglobales bacterium]|nr:hypothetical protein [Terriglobales bacterium]